MTGFVGWEERTDNGKRRREQTTATAGPSTTPFAKSANGFAQDDNFGREAGRKPATTKATARTKATATAVARMLFGWGSGFLRCAAHGETVSSFGRNDEALFCAKENRKCWRVRVERSERTG